MSKYSNLKFFDSNSDELNLNYDSITQAWDGIVYLPEVSVGLYETLTIYILEEVRGELGETKYIKPITPTSTNIIVFIDPSTTPIPLKGIVILGKLILGLRNLVLIFGNLILKLGNGFLKNLFTVFSTVSSEF